MKPIPIAQYLNQAQRQRVETPLTQASPIRQRILHPSASTENVEDRIQESYERGRRDGLAEAHEEGERRLAALARETEDRVRSETERAVTEAYAEIGRTISSSIAELEHRISSVVARILGQFAIKDHERRITDALAEDLAQMLGGAGSKIIRIRGPKAAIDTLASQLSDRAIETTVEEDDGVEISVIADSTLIETRLGAFAARVVDAIA